MKKSGLLKYEKKYSKHGRDAYMKELVFSESPKRFGTHRKGKLKSSIEFV
jgi:hypothetical protein